MIEQKSSDATDTSRAEPSVGDVMPKGHKYAGWIYVGNKSDGDPLYAASEDSGVYMWQEAMTFASREGGNIRVPTKEELNMLYEVRNEGALKGSFNLTGAFPGGWYWSSTEYRDNAVYAWGHIFDVEYQEWYHKGYRSSLRLVRG
jgi:Protein of unknown function (DUF1566)